MKIYRIFGLEFSRVLLQLEIAARKTIRIIAGTTGRVHLIPLQMKIMATHLVVYQQVLTLNAELSENLTEQMIMSRFQVMDL